MQDPSSSSSATTGGMRPQNHDDNNHNNNPILRQTIKRLQQEYTQEKDRLQQHLTQQCQKEKQQLSHQLTQKTTLELSSLKEDLIKQYRLEKEIMEHRIQLQYLKQSEDQKKELLSKYREEIESLRREYDHSSERKINEMKQDLLKQYYSFQGQLPSVSPVSGASEENTPAASSVSLSRSFEEWKGELFLSEIANVTNALQAQCVREKEVLLQQSALLPLTPADSSLFIERNFLFVGLVVVTLIVAKWITSSFWKRDYAAKPSYSVITKAISEDNQDLLPLQANTHNSIVGDPIHVIESLTPQLTPARNRSSPAAAPLDAQYDVFLSYALNDSNHLQENVQFLAQSLAQQYGWSVYHPQSEQDHSKERVLDALDRSKCVIICLTEGYHQRTNPSSNHLAGEDDWCRFELNYAIGALTTTKIILVVFEESMNKKTLWKHRFRTDLYSIKPIPFFVTAELELRVKDIADRVKATIK